MTKIYEDFYIGETGKQLKDILKVATSGTEFKTNVKLDTKDVYRLIKYLGMGRNAYADTYSTGLDSSYKIIKFTLFYASSGSKVLPIPYISDGGQVLAGGRIANASTVVFSPHFDATGYECWIDIEYTK